MDTVAPSDRAILSNSDQSDYVIPVRLMEVIGNGNIKGNISGKQCL